MTKIAVVLLAAAAVAAAQPSRRAVLIDVDGVRRDTIEQLYGAGKLPNLARIFDAAVWFDNASTVTPSVTMPAQASIATGTTPAQHGIVGNQWYDREKDRLYDYMNASGLSCVYGFSILGGAECLGGLGNRHLKVKTIYEVAAGRGFDSVVAYNQFWKGASRPAAPTADEARAFLPGNKLDFRKFDTQMTGRVVSELQAHGLPALLVLYFTGADTIGHEKGIGAQAEYVAEVIDPAVGKILDIIGGLDAEWRSHTMFVMTSDHGRTEAVEHPEDVTLLADILAVLPKGSHVAQSGGMAFVYLTSPDASVPQRLREKFESVIESVRPTEAARAGDYTISLRSGHYFGNAGKGSHHGAATKADLNVPLLVAMPGVGSAHSDVAVSITQVARTMAEFVGFSMEGSAAALPLVREMRKR